MVERRRPRDDGELDRVLIELRHRLGYPPTPDLAGAVRDRLARPAAPKQHPPKRLPFLFLGHRAAVVLLALTLLAIGTLAMLPSARTAVADRLGLRGVAIRFLDGAPTPASPPVGGGLLLGRRVDLDAAQDGVPFPIHVPTLDALGPPDEVYRSGVPSDGMISFVYRADRDLPAGLETGVGALLTQFRAATDRVLVEKGFFVKGVPTGARLETVTINGGPGYWIEGDAHSFLYRDPSGNVEVEEYRLAANVLLWEQDGLTFRLESALPKERAVAIAESVRRRG